MTVTYKLGQFEGPLNLLLHLIDQAEIHIQDISMSEIADQYMEYLHNIQKLELEIMSEFLVMAATLLYMKSQHLLPKPPIIEWEEDATNEELDPRAELIHKLLEYQKYKRIAHYLQQCEEERSLIFSKEPEDLTPFMPTVFQHLLDGLHVSDLIDAFCKVRNRASSRTQVATIHRDEIPFRNRMKSIMEVLFPLGKDGKVMFSHFLDDPVIRSELVGFFLALLELMKMKQIHCYQDSLFADIVIQWSGEVDEDGLSAAEVDYGKLIIYGGG